VTGWSALPDEVVETQVAPDIGEIGDLPAPWLALHVCCGPCASAVIERLKREWSVACVWHNPNIQPAEEHERRLASMRTVAERTGASLAVLPYGY